MTSKHLTSVRPRLLRAGLLCLCTCALLEVPVATGAPQASNNPNPGPSPTTLNGFQQGSIDAIGQGASAFPRVWRPYVEQPLPHVVLENSPRLHSLIRDGKLELSLSDASKS